MRNIDLSAQNIEVLVQASSPQFLDEARSPGKRNVRTREEPVQASPPFPGAAVGLTRATRSQREQVGWR